MQKSTRDFNGHYYPIHVQENQLKPNQFITWVGCISLIIHMIILLVVYFFSGRAFISNNMLNNVWYTGTITMLFLIEHLAWINLLWVFATPSYYGLFIAYSGVLLATISWIMEVAIPVEPDPLRQHSLFALCFIIGCLVNLFGSLLLLPGSSQSTNVTFKYIMGSFGLIGALTCLTWAILRISNVEFSDEPLLQIIAYIMYLAGLLAGIIWALLI